MAEKVDFKRVLRGLYAPTRTPAVVEVPEMAFLMIDGHGDPNTSAQYRDWCRRCSPSPTPPGSRASGRGDRYGVMPLEGLWFVPDMATFSSEDKSAWDWTMMIMQQDEVTEAVLADAKASAAAAAPPALDRLAGAVAEGPLRRCCTSAPTAPRGRRSPRCRVHRRARPSRRQAP